MKRYRFTKLLLMAVCFTFTTNITAQLKGGIGIAELDKSISEAAEQYTAMLSRATSADKYPRSIERMSVSASDWTSGFFPGSLWYLYEYTGVAKWKEEAIKRTSPIESQKYNQGTHDLGFMLGCSFGNGYRLLNDDDYKDILITASKSLISRYDTDVKCIRSWDFGSWDFPVIIDNMMNLDMLFEASKMSGDTKYYDIAVQHALTTINNHFRDDFSSYHVVNYNKTTGDVISKETHQGYADETAWARGQAWGLYGFSLCYRETKDARFLEMAEKIAGFYMNHTNLPADKIPYWDFDAPSTVFVPRDASAAAIVASALIELSGYSESNGEAYLAFAISTLESLSSDDYTAIYGENNNFILMHATGNKPGYSEVNGPLNYADYYYLEALGRLRKLRNTEPVADFTTLANYHVVAFDASMASDADADKLTYTWDFGDGEVKTSSFPIISHTYGSSGTYTILLEVKDNWGRANSHTKNIQVDVLSDIKNLSAEDYFSVYPNPSTNGSFKVNVSELMVKSVNSIKILDLTGETIYTNSSPLSKLKNGTINIKANTLEAGIYFILLNADNNIYTEKLIVK